MSHLENDLSLPTTSSSRFNNEAIRHESRHSNDLEMEDYNEIHASAAEQLPGNVEELNRRTVRKLDLYLLPFLALLFLFNSLDRSNIGNAEVCQARCNE
jgi:hypothetical protein